MMPLFDAVTHCSERPLTPTCTRGWGFAPNFCTGFCLFLKNCSGNADPGGTRAPPTWHLNRQNFQRPVYASYQPAPTEAPMGQPVTAPPTVWQQYNDPNGVPYWHNTQTGETTWNNPWGAQPEHYKY